MIKFRRNKVMYMAYILSLLSVVLLLQMYGTSWYTKTGKQHGNDAKSFLDSYQDNIKSATLNENNYGDKATKTNDDGRLIWGKVQEEEDQELTLEQNEIRQKRNEEEKMSKILRHNPRFVFITNTEECLDKYWLSEEDFFGDPLKCDCDCIVISYHRPCRTNTKSHISYIFEPKATTLTKGKNLGVLTARMRTDKNYLYYVVHDDDVIFKHTIFQTEDNLKIPPLRTFQNFLLSYNPAVCAPSFVHFRQLGDFLLPFQRKICHKIPSNITAPMTHFDACTYAMHADAVPYLYPLPEHLSGVRGILSHAHMQIQAMITFPAHTMAYLGIRTKNVKTHRYSVYKDMNSTEKEEKEIPSWINSTAEPELAKTGIERWEVMVNIAKGRIPEEYLSLPLTRYIFEARGRSFPAVKELLCGDLLEPGHKVIPFLLTKQFTTITCVRVFALQGVCPKSDEWLTEDNLF